MRLGWYTPLVLLFPHRFVSTDAFWTRFDLREWSRRSYEWTSDPYNGWVDIAQPPHDTLARGRGDCEDYALVAASWALANDRPGVGLGICFQWPYPWPRHVVCYDDEYTYSSGHIRRESLTEYEARSRYWRVLARPIRLRQTAV